MKKNSVKPLLGLLLLIILALVVHFSFRPKPPGEDYTGWAYYAGTRDGARYSALDGINRENVAGLQVAWTYSTGDRDTGNRSQIQCNPIVVKGVLYGTSPKLRLFAVDAATGRPLWTFDPFAGADNRALIMGINRGLAYWQDAGGGDARIFYGVRDRLFAIDAATGRPVAGFGQNGSIDLDEGLDRAVPDASVTATSPGVVYKDLIIMGGRLSETAEAAPGHIRAYDVRTGRRRWIFHTIPHPGERGYATWKDRDSWKKIGGANCWTGFSLDAERGIVYVPLGSASYDFYGGNRKGQNLFANSLLALDAATGRYRWHFQTVHHDILDRDLPATPNLVTVLRAGRKVDAVAQITKTGYVFLFDRTTGQPLFPIREAPVPRSDLPGEEAWPTQPVPVLPEPFTRQAFREEDVTNISPEAHAAMLRKWKAARKGGPFMPPSKQGTLIFPGFDGGGEWGGAAYDPQTGWLYVNANEMPWILQMIDVPKPKVQQSLRGAGRAVYAKYCITCHGADLKGDAQQTYPALLALEKKYKEDDLRTILDAGRNRMPAFKQLPEGEKKALVAFLLKKEDRALTAAASAAMAKGAAPAIPYTSTGYNRMLDAEGYPGIKPPWGTLNAINLHTGLMEWKVPLGEFAALTKKGIPPTGTENYGGPLVTAGGLVFIAATMDEKFRAFDKKTGKVVWEAQLPAAGFATPCTYQVDGRQYVVIAAGGGKGGNRSGDQYMAFALPR